MQRIIFGLFDGQNMDGDDGKVYPINANYASKSRLVEGDILKLIIEEDGNFIFKQAERVGVRRIPGILTFEKTVAAKNKVYNILPSSITYFKAEPGDELIILVPADRECTWAAVENVIKNIDYDKEL